MCLIAFALDRRPDLPLVFAANRDEFYARPSAAADWWQDHPHVLGGRDLEAGGTWLAVTRAGRFAAVTNYREPGAPAGAVSRGSLVADFVVGTQPCGDYLAGVAANAQRYSGFNLIVGERGEAWYFSNRAGRGPLRLQAGVYGLSNHLLDTDWPKVCRAREGLGAALERPAALEASLFDLLAEREAAPAERLPDTGVGPELERRLAPLFIAGEAYGTRASTVMTFSAGGEVSFVERGFDAGRALGERRFRFRVEP